MFGWEFPPHISGGLGTACEGLTNALVKEGVQLIFVIPKTFGNEQRDHFTLLDASKVPVTITETSSIKTKIAKTRIVQPASRQGREETIVRKINTGITVVEVASTLSAYAYPETVKYTVEQWIEEWNTILHAPVVPATITESYIETTDRQVVTKRIGSHTFSGTYGPDLFGEILRYAETAREIAREHPADIIHVHDWITFPAGLAAKAVSGKKLVVHVHATEVDRSGDSPDPLIFKIEKQGFDDADHIVTVSEWTRQIVIKHYNIKPSRISVVHNGVIAREHPVPKGRRLGSHMVTFFGRVTYQKGPIHFVHAAFKVLERFPDAHFIIAGSGDLFTSMVEQVAHLRLSSQFHFTGFLKGNDVDKLWGLSDVYVMPSVSEPFGITPLEAIQAGIPVIVSRQSGVSEVMPHAIAVDFWDTDALANAICGVLAYESLSTTLRKNSREAVKELTWNKSAKKVKALYRRLV